MKKQIIILSLFAALIVIADPIAGNPPVSGSVPAPTSPARPMPTILPGLNRMPGQNQNPIKPNSPNDFDANLTNNNHGVEGGAGFSAGNTNATRVQPGSRGGFENGQPFTTNIVPGQNVRTNRQNNHDQRWMTNRPSAFTNRPAIFTNRPTPFTNRPSPIAR